MVEPYLGVSDTSADLALSPAEIISDYRIAYRSRQVSIVCRREVLSGKAKFGIFGDGKELPQLAMARFFRKGDFRSGYYRDQTFMFATGAYSIQEFFAQLYAHADVEADPATAGRAMNAHFASRSLNPDGSWKNLVEQYNSAADLSPTASQMPRLVGLAYASRLYRQVDELQTFSSFSDHGNEVAFGVIGNASTSEGLFWEAVNAIGVLKSPAVITIYDDGYGISVTNEYQMIKQDLSELLKGFQRVPGTHDGYDVYTVHGWDYPALIKNYQTAVEATRREHVPAILHVIELTQPQGHSTSGSHERYKNAQRLQWEQEFDCIKRMREWMLASGIASTDELDAMEAEDRHLVEETRKRAWEAFSTPIFEEREQAARLLEQAAGELAKAGELLVLKERLLNTSSPVRREIMAALHEALVSMRGESGPANHLLAEWKKRQEVLNRERYSSYLYSQSSESALNVAEIKPVYSDASPSLYGYDVVNTAFDAAFSRDPRVIAFGEDVGQLGDVNQGFRGLQEKYGILRISDTGIREATIVGQAIGLAMRGLRPIAEIQYLDYLLYALQIMADDLANLHWRTRGGQKAPVIVRTRGHRLEGIWHSGSPMAGVINLVRGMYVLTPRDLTRAAGFYNTMLQSDEPAIIVEVLNSYRVKERLPDNIGEMTIPVGVPEVLREGGDLTLVTYGACCRIVMEAASRLSKVGIETEVIDVQSLLPFDRHGRILELLKKTGRILFVDEDVPGGTTAYMLQEVIERQGGYYWLDSPPRTLPGKAHRPAYGSDGDYYSKPNVEEVFDTAYDMIKEADPGSFPDYL